MVRRANEAVFFHTINQPGCAVIANPQLTLNPARRCLLAFKHDLARLAILRVFFVVVAAHSAKVETAIFGFFGHRLNLFGLPLAAPMVCHAADFIIGNKWTMDTRQPATARHIQHVALAQQLLGALFAQYGTAINF